MSNYKKEIKEILKRRGLESDFYNVWFELAGEMPDDEMDGLLDTLLSANRDELESYTKTLYNKNNAEKSGDIGGWDKIFRSKN